MDAAVFGLMLTVAHITRDSRGSTAATGEKK